MTVVITFIMSQHVFSFYRPHIPLSSYFIFDWKFISSWHARKCGNISRFNPFPGLRKNILRNSTIDQTSTRAWKHAIYQSSKWWAFYFCDFPRKFDCHGNNFRYLQKASRESSTFSFAWNLWRHLKIFHMISIISILCLLKELSHNFLSKNVFNLKNFSYQLVKNTSLKSGREFPLNATQRSLFLTLFNAFLFKLSVRLHNTVDLK